MNTWEPSLQKDKAYQPQPDWFEAILPLPAIPLILLLFLIAPIFLLAAESLLAPVYEFIQSLLLPVNAGVTYATLPFQLLLKIGLFAIFTFTGVMLLLLKITCLYHEVWSHFFSQPHPRHTVYHPDQQDSMISLFNWSLFRLFKVLGPLVMWIAILIAVSVLWYWLFNSFTDFGFFSFQLQFSLGFFLVTVLSLFVGIEVFKTFWSALTTNLGDIAAITEPEKPTQVIYDRAKKLAFGSPWILIVYPIYFLFYLAVIVEVVLLIATYDIGDLLSFKADLMMILGFQFVTFVVFIMLNAMKFMTYHDALVRYYRQHVR